MASVHKDIKFILVGIVSQLTVHKPTQGLAATVEARTGKQVDFITHRKVSRSDALPLWREYLTNDLFPNAQGEKR